jgi:hypothetical protein
MFSLLSGTASASVTVTPISKGCKPAAGLLLTAELPAAEPPEAAGGGPSVKDTGFRQAVNRAARMLPYINRTSNFAGFIDRSLDNFKKGCGTLKSLSRRLKFDDAASLCQIGRAHV